MSARNRHFVRGRALVRAMSTVGNGMHYDERDFRGGACRCSHVGVREASLWEWCVSMLPDGGVWVLAVAVRDAEEICLLPFEMGCGYGKLESGKGEKREPHPAVVASIEERSLCNVDQIDRLVRLLLPCGRRVLSKVPTSLFDQTPVPRIPSPVIKSHAHHPFPHPPPPTRAATMSLQDRFASQDSLSLLSGAATLSLITAASQAALAYNLPVVVCLSLSCVHVF